MNYRYSIHTSFLWIRGHYTDIQVHVSYEKCIQGLGVLEQKTYSLNYLQH